MVSYVFQTRRRVRRRNAGFFFLHSEEVFALYKNNDLEIVIKHLFQQVSTWCQETVDSILQPFIQLTMWLLVSMHFDLDQSLWFIWFESEIMTLLIDLVMASIILQPSSCWSSVRSHYLTVCFLLLSCEGKLPNNLPYVLVWVETLYPSSLNRSWRIWWRNSVNS